MAGVYGNKVVTDGLVYFIDTKNIVSYPGSGTTWTDLVGAKKGTLANGAGFTSGYMYFDGVDDEMNTGITIQPAAGSNLQSFCSWCYGTTGQFFGSNANGWGQFHLIVDWYYGYLRFGGSYYGGAGETTDLYSVTSNSSGWNYVSLVKTAAYYFDIYFNGQLLASNVYRNSVYSSQLQLGTFWSYYHQPQYISSLQIYNKSLSSSEVLLNYNSMKKKYGIV